MGWFQDEVNADQQAVRDRIQELENDAARLRRDMALISDGHTRDGIASAIRHIENEIMEKRGQLR